MPVILGDNLTLEDNKLSAVYKELYTKLNKAYAWTYERDTSSGGTCVLFGNDNIVSTFECPEISNCYASIPQAYMTSKNQVIINGIIYDRYGNQKGNKTDWKFIDNYDNYCIDSQGKLYKNFTSSSPYGDLIYTKVSGNYAISDGKLYYISGSTPVQVGNENTWTNISCGSYNYGISNGYLYSLNSTNLTLLGTENNWVKFFTGAPASGYNIVLNSNNEAYLINGNNLSSTYTNNVKKIITLCTWSGTNIVLKNNGKIYKSSSYSNFILTEINSNINSWTDICGTVTSSTTSTNKFYAIGDGKLYICNVSSSSPTFTQIGVESNYQKIDGCYECSIGWTGEATHMSQTILTTKNPISGDKTYSNENLTEYSTIQSATGVTITDQYRTYNRDGSKDSFFTKIPPASIHETITTIDILRATNPNN